MFDEEHVQMGGRVRVAGNTFCFTSIPDMEWPVLDEYRDRIEDGDVIWVELPDVAFPLSRLEQITEEARRTYKLVRVSKGGDPAFQGSPMKRRQKIEEG